MQQSDAGYQARFDPVHEGTFENDRKPVRVEIVEEQHETGVHHNGRVR